MFSASLRISENLETGSSNHFENQTNHKFKIFLYGALPDIQGIFLRHPQRADCNPMMAKSTVLAFVAAACAVGGADAFGVSSAAVQLRGSSFASGASAARPVQVPFCLDSQRINAARVGLHCCRPWRPR
jgi:hypothetical protein